LEKSVQQQNTSRAKKGNLPA